MSYSRLLMRLWHRLTGRSTDFPLNVRVFHSVCLIIIVALAYNVPFNYLVGLKDIALLSACYVAIFSLVYYLSRFKGLTSIAFGVFVCAGNVLFTINYFLNSGIDGPTDLFFLLTMVIMITVAPVRQYWILVCVNLLLVTGLHLLQYMSPQLVPQSYTNLQNRYIDITSAYWVVMGLILFNFYFVRRNYEVERRSAEQKAELMKVLNEEKNKLFSIISHDLRAPLTNVQNYLELLTELEISEEESLVIKRKLLDSTRSTLDMLNNVLSWSQGQMTGLKFKLADLNAYDVLMPQLLLFTNIASNKNISVVITIDHDIRIVGNENMLQLIVRNLINNAIKFTASGGRIEVTASVDGESCIFSVLDSGNGSPVKLGTNIFYLNSGTTAGTANEKGVGLGLVLCKEFTEAMQGQIWFECGAESGTTFFVELPLSQPVVDAEGLTLV